VIGANWKTALDAFNENYHAIGVHPQLLRYLDGTGWHYEALGRHSFIRRPAGVRGRTDPRLRDLRIDRAELPMAPGDDIGGLDILSEDDRAAVAQLPEIAGSIPDEISNGALMAGMRRMMAGAKGVDLSAFSDDEVIFGGSTNLFPNMMLTVNGGA